VKGIVYTDPALPSLSPQQRSAVYKAASRVLAAIHSVQACLYLLMMVFLKITKNMLKDSNIHDKYLNHM
jgi:hypothetical protein